MRNVVLVTIDSLRADHCGFMGYGAETTPTLDEMARNGVDFETAIAPGPSTYESMPAIFTGRHMSSYPTGEDDTLDNRGRLIQLNSRRQTIPERFAEAGYTTAAFSTNPYTASHTNFARGFDSYEDFLGGREGRLMRAASELPVASELKHLVTLIRGDRASKPWQGYYDAIQTWVDQATEPYFLWLFLLDPHTPYLSNDDYRPGSRLEMYYHNWKLWADKKWGVDFEPDRQALIDLYDATIRSTDTFLSQLRSDVGGDPVIAVHADHGEAFGEHGTYGHEPELYQENLHVPLVVSNVPAASVDEPISVGAVPEMLCSIAADPTEFDPTAYTTSHVISRTEMGDKWAVYDGRWKYIVDTDSASEALYDTAADPNETRNVIADNPEQRGVCKQRLERHRSHQTEKRLIASGVEQLEVER